MALGTGCLTVVASYKGFSPNSMLRRALHRRVAFLRALEHECFKKGFLADGRLACCQSPDRVKKASLWVVVNYEVSVPTWDKKGVPRGEEIQGSKGYQERRELRMTSE